jgi:nucleoside-diphosphate-sugar epimerase
MNFSRLIPNTITKILNKEKPVIYSGVMHFKREFIHVDDVCNAYTTISEYGKSGEAYNVGTGEVCRVGDLIEMICNKMGWTEGIDIVDKSFPEIPLQYLSSDKIRTLGWKPKISLDEGLDKTIKWYENKHSN